ncbi:uncharacterized protein [Halyomorpha halys]|uniref:uncharacterized protein isoform X1 n=2 Tax=Halyomorpha halys TaxID=286706 RepID=UPI0006D4F235|nr:uncharacterized protein LOC106683306 isoform X1 [Halyomorpha halys]
MLLFSVVALLAVSAASGQRITTIQLDGVQYFISRMNPYSPELNYFLAYQYCRSIGLQLASFETKEKSDSIMQYLRNAGYNKYDFWTAGNRLGTDMLIWMSTGLPFNATFDYMRKAPGDDMPVARQLGAVEQRKDSGAANGCVALRAPDLIWDTDDCTNIKDFICEQTRCYYYNYGSIPVSSAQGNYKMKKMSTMSTEATTEKTTTKTSSTTELPSSSTMEDTTLDTLDYSTENEVNDTAGDETTITPIRARTMMRNSAETNDSDTQENVPWSWARNIMLEKPVLKKSATL